MFDALPPWNKNLANLNPVQQTAPHMKACIESYIFDLLVSTLRSISLVLGGC